MQTKRTVFHSRILPYFLLAPQLVITLIFFVWPAAQAVRQSFLRQDPFGLKETFVWFANYTRLLDDSDYMNALGVTFVFAVGVAVLSGQHDDGALEPLAPHDLHRLQPD